MHNKFIDKKRRFINFRDAQVDHILPEHFAASYPKFISLLENYYDFQDQNNSTELLNHLFAARDVNETDITLLNFIEDELLLGESYFLGFTTGGENKAVELRAAANFSNILFRSKGSKFAIEWFFRSFYGEEVEVLYPKENVFQVGVSDSLIGPDSLKYITDDKLYQTFALLIRVGIPISKWREVFKLFAHPAGMYLAGEVFLVDEVSPNLTTLTDIVEQYLSPTYTLSTATDFDEGVDLTLLANGVDLRNSGTDFLYWYGKHVTTNDSDFGANYAEDPTRLGLPDSNNAQYIAIDPTGATTGVGYGYVKSIIDPNANPTEADETFQVFLRDKNRRVVDNATVTLNNLVESYVITFPDATSPPRNIREGSNPMKMLIQGTNVPYGGTTDLRWYIDPLLSSATLLDSDFAEYSGANSLKPGSTNTAGDRGYPDSVGVAVPVRIGDSAQVLTRGNFHLTPIYDGVTGGDENETVRLTLINQNDVPVLSASAFFIIDNESGFSTITNNNIVEGANLIIEYASGTFNAGKTLQYSIIDSVSTEQQYLSTGLGPRIQGDLTGTFETGVDGSATLTFLTELSDSYNIGTQLSGQEGSVGGIFRVLDTSVTPNVQTDGGPFYIFDAPPVYTITPSLGIAPGGTTVTYTVTGSNITEDTVHFFVTNAPADPTSDADFVPSPPPRSTTREAVTIVNQVGTFDLEFAADGDPGDQNFIVELWDASTGGSKVAELPYVIQGGSTTYAVDINGVAPAASTVDEDGSTINVVFTASSDGTYKYYLEPFTTGSAVNIADDFIDVTNGNVSVATSSNIRDVVITGGTGTIQLTVTADFASEAETGGSESFAAVMLSSAVGNPQLARSNELIVNDTSVSQYTVLSKSGTSLTSATDTTRDENQNLNIVVQANVLAANEQVYVELLGGSTWYSNIQAGPFTFTPGDVNDPDGTAFVFVAVGDNATENSNRFITVRVTTGDFASGSPTKTIALLTTQVIDPAAGYSIETSTAGPYNEGDSITFDITTTSIPDGTELYVRPVGIKARPILTTNGGYSSTGYMYSGFDQDFNVSDVLYYASPGFYDPATGTYPAGFASVTSSQSTNFTASKVLQATPLSAPDYKVMYAAAPNVWEYFDETQITGTPITITGNAATFVLNTSENTSQTIDRNFTMQLMSLPYEEDADPSRALATGDFTLQNITVGDAVPNIVLRGTADATELAAYTFGYEPNSPQEVYAALRFNFKTNGELEIYELEQRYAQTGSAYQVRYLRDDPPGENTWTSSTPSTPGNFTVEVASTFGEQNNPAFNETGIPYVTLPRGTYFVGEYQTPRTLDTLQTYEVRCTASGVGNGEGPYFGTIQFKVTDNFGNFNTKTVQWRCSAENLDLTNPGGGF